MRNLQQLHTSAIHRISKHFNYFILPSWYRRDVPGKEHNDIMEQHFLVGNEICFSKGIYFQGIFSAVVSEVVESFVPSTATLRSNARQIVVELVESGAARE
jgi:hypothetical protein